MSRKIVCMALGLMVGTMCFGQPNTEVTKVHVIFKTHLDIGYTDFATKVEQRYIDEFIPKALAVNDELKAEGSADRYVWTTGSWLIDAYLKQASPDAVKKFEQALKQGDIAWNSMPYTIESESANLPLFEGMLKLSQRLDKQFGKKTIAAKMTDVPGHTRSIVTPLYDAGIRLLHIGLNYCAPIPSVPTFCKWRNTDGKEIVLMYQKSYGETSILPDGKTVIAINFTHDNHGPHTLQQVKSIYSKLREQYPNAQVVGSTLSAVAEDLSTMTAQMPVLTSEIGDSWIYGYASSPVMMSRFRTLSRLYAEWLQTGKLNKDSDIAIDYAVKLGMVAEHTWGYSWIPLQNWDKYDVDIFNASRHLPGFKIMEKSWKEKADMVDNAIAILPINLQNEAKAAVANIGFALPKDIKTHDKAKEINETGAITQTLGGVSLVSGEIAYQAYSQDDYEAFFKPFLSRNNHGSRTDMGKTGLDKTKAISATIVAHVASVAVGKSGKDKKIECVLSFADDARIDKRVLPEQINTQYIISKKDGSVELTVSLVNKPAVRLPEAYWVSFVPSQVISVFAEKTGGRVDVMDVIKSGGNHQMHGIDNYVDIVTSKGVFRITSLDAPLVAIGERKSLNYSDELPDLSKGIHFCLFNNLWGTNFTFWWEGSISYRFKIEMI